MIKHKLSRSPGGEDPNLLSLYSAKHCLKDVSVCVRLIGSESLEQIRYSDKTRREFLMGTSGLYFGGFLFPGKNNNEIIFPNF